MEKRSQHGILKKQSDFSLKIKGNPSVPVNIGPNITDGSINVNGNDE
jgi:hypothetical protein